MTEVSSNDASTPDAEARVRAAARAFVAHARDMERSARRSAVSAPSEPAREAFAQAFWKMLAEVSEAAGHRRARAVPALQRALFEETDALLMRHELFVRARYRPHGYPGDYQTFERIYALEAPSIVDAAEAFIPNCLAHAFKTIGPAASAWERRHFVAERIRARIERGPARILDLACGGTRYLRDVLDAGEHLDQLDVLCVDQDPAAIAFVEREIDKRGPLGARVAARCLRHADLPALIAGRRFDLAIASGLIDYLDDDGVRLLFALFHAHLAPGGEIVTSNLMHVGLPSFCMDWIGDWPIVHRDVAAVVALLPEQMRATTRVTRDGTLVLVSATREGD